MYNGPASRQPPPQQQQQQQAQQHRRQQSSEGGRGSTAREQPQSNDDEKERIVKSCFSRVDENGNLLESYITHVRVVEDSYYPSQRPPPSSAPQNKKKRAIIVAVRKSGRVRVHKARENPNGTFQIGKSWNLDDLTKIEGDTEDASAFIMHMGKPYYWVAQAPKERSVFVSSAIKIYSRYTGGNSPELVNIESSSNTASSTNLSQQAQPPQAQPPPTPPPQPPQQSPQRQIPPQQPPHPPPPGRPQVQQQSSNYTVRTPPIAQGQFGGTETPPSQTGRGPQTTYSPHTSQGNESQTPNFSHRRSNSGAPLGASPAGSPIPAQAQVQAQQQQTAPPDQASHHKKRPSLQSNSASASLEAIPARMRSHSNYASQPSARQGPSASSLPPFQQSASNSSPSLPYQARGQEPVQSEPRTHTPAADTTVQSNEENDDSVYQSEHRRKPSSIQDIKVFAHSANTNGSAPAGDDDDLAALAQTSSQVEHDILESLRVDQSEIQSQEPAQPEVNENEEVEREDTVAALESGNKSKPSAVSTHSREAMRRSLSFSAESNASAVEETLGEFNWNGREDSKSLEVNISNELASIEAANTHNVVDLDDRLDDLDQILDDAITECQRLDTVLAFFSVQLGSFGDDIRHIESQGKGIQVQTNHQKDLWTELHRILKTVSLSEDSLVSLRSGRFDTIKDLEVTETALVDLYRALSMSDPGENRSDLSTMNAVQEKRHIYEQTRGEFGSRFKQFVESRFQKAMQEVQRGMNDQETKIWAVEFTFMRQLYPLTGIMLYLREIDEVSYDTVLRMYEYTAKRHYDQVITSYMLKYNRHIKQILQRTEKFSFASTTKSSSPNEGIVSKSLKRSGTLAKFKSSSSENRENRGNAGSPQTNEDSAGWTPNPTSRNEIKRCLQKVTQDITEVVILQQELLIQLFHLSSFSGHGYPDFIKRYPVTKRKRGEEVIQPTVREIEPDVTRGKELLVHISGVFTNLQEELFKFIDFVTPNSSMEVPMFLALVEQCIAKFETTNQDFLLQVLRRIKDKLTISWQHFVREQITAIGSTLVSSKKRKGVVYFVKVLPRFCRTIEEDFRELSSNEHPISDLPVRRVMDDSYEKIFKEVFQNLQRIAKDSSVEGMQQTTNASSSGTNTTTTTTTAGEHEDKEQLNYHIMMIENMNVLKEGLGEETNGVLMSYRGNAMVTYRQQLDMYVKTVIRRPLGRIIDWVDAIDAILAKNPTDNPATRTSYNRSAAKRLLAGFDNKEMRKGVEALYKRVEKHFWGENEESHADKDPQLVTKAWSAVQAEYSGVITRLSKILDTYYNDGSTPDLTASGGGGAGLLEVTKADVGAAFSRK